MKFTQESIPAQNLVRGYGGGELRINDTVCRGAVILSATMLISEPDIHDMGALIGIDAQRILDLEPELVLLGTGARQIFPPPSFSVPFLRAGVGLEIMDTGAACRTFNVLMGERRRVVALLLA
jgi:uncharacterized protein